MDYLAIRGFLEQTSIEHYFDVKTSDLVSFRVGGYGKVAIYPKDIAELSVLIKYLQNEKYIILGNGTNCYFTDNYYDGAIIVTNRINRVSVDKEYISAQCGASLTRVCKIALEESLSGLEFAYGIPGTIGGALYMNASAFGEEIGSTVVSSTVLDLNSGDIYELSAEEHKFGKKYSVFQEKNLCALETRLKCYPSSYDKILSKMNENSEYRRTTQPLDFPSAGSTFVKPEDDYASRLIDSAGLKGARIGDAQVSLKHAGFIINRENATADEVKSLINLIKDTIYKKFKINLTEEIIYIE